MRAVIEIPNGGKSLCSASAVSFALTAVGRLVPVGIGAAAFP